MAIDFPNSPSPGTNHTVDGKTWTFTDGKWALNVSVGGVQGPAGVAIQGTAPATTDVLWADTSDTGLVIVPAGGTTGQVLAKSSSASYDTAWATPITSGDMALKADLASPTFTGTPTLPTGTIATTQTAGNSSTAIATTAFVGTAVANLVDSAPATLNTLDELAAALGDDANFATTTATAIGLKAPLASPTFTGTPTLPSGTIATTQSAGNNTTAVATTAFVTTAVVNVAPQTTVYTSGSGTYTVPSGARWLSVKMVGGGGGGATGHSDGSANGSAGTNTTFGTGIASGGGGGLVNDNGGIGVASTMISGGVGLAVAGGDGGPSAAPYGTGRAANEGGNGGSSAFGGGGSGRGGSNAASGVAGKANTGGGGGAGGGSNVPGTYAGGGGASGGYVECIIASPSATYSYAVGAGGAGGSNGSTTGGAGGSGVIYVVAYF